MRGRSLGGMKPGLTHSSCEKITKIFMIPSNAITYREKNVKTFADYLTTTGGD
jgi:hypothetical protein